MKTRIAFALSALLSAACAHAADRSVDLLIDNATVVDLHDGSLHANRHIAVDDGRIVAIADDREARGFKPARRVDAAGKFAIPGLWDMHVHFGGGEALADENRDLLPLYVAHGVTTVRDAAGDLSEHVLQWRDQVRKGELQSPTIYTSGPKIEGKGSIWPGDQEVADETELRAAFDRLQAMRVDFVKITESALSPQLFMAALAEAKRRGMKTSAHVPLGLVLDDVAAAGLGSIEHMGYVLRAGSPREREIDEAFLAGKIKAGEANAQLGDSYDRDTALAAYRKLAARGLAITPTLHGSRVIDYLDQDDHKNDDYLHYIGPGLKATYTWRVERASKADAAAIAKRHAHYELEASQLPLLQQAGMTILAGTDAGFLNSYNYPGIGLHDELREYVRYGLTPLQALQSATLRNAAFLGHDKDSGDLAEGKVADIVLLERNPLQDIDATRAIDAVVLKGDYLDRKALDALLAGARARVAEREAKAAQP